LYTKVDSIPSIRGFMKSHCFAVWDFMSLLKSLQSKLTVVTVPWHPPKDISAARFINEIVVGEECDEPGHIQHEFITHYDLYLGAMKEVNAFSEPLEDLVSEVSKGVAWDQALKNNSKRYSNIIPPATLRFTENTIQMARFGELHQVASYFLFGREEPIPAMFKRIVERLDESNINAPFFKRYLERHIEVDGEDHGPMSENLIKTICKDDSKKWEDVYHSANSAIQDRLKLWDAVQEDLLRPVTLYETIGGRKTLENAIMIFKERNSADIAGFDFNVENQKKLVNIMSGVLGGPIYINQSANDLKKIKPEMLSGNLIKIFTDLVTPEREISKFHQHIEVKTRETLQGL